MRAFDYLTVELPDMENNLAIYRQTIWCLEWEAEYLLSTPTGTGDTVAESLMFYTTKDPGCLVLI